MGTGSYGSELGELHTPWGVVSGNGDIFVAEYDNSRIAVFGADGKTLRCFGSKGSENEQLSMPAGLCLSADSKEMFLADYGNHRVCVVRGMLRTQVLLLLCTCVCCFFGKAAG